MARKSRISESLPAAVAHTLSQLGRNIRTARLRRKLRMEDLAERIGISRFVPADIENGKPTTAIVGYVWVLWVLGLLDQMKAVADPDRDQEGKILERAQSQGGPGQRTLDVVGLSKPPEWVASSGRFGMPCPITGDGAWLSIIVAAPDWRISTT